jgi:hypothetical protein
MDILNTHAGKVVVYSRSDPQSKYLVNHKASPEVNWVLSLSVGIPAFAILMVWGISEVVR